MDDFHTTSTLILEEASDFFEHSWPHADVDLLDGTLTVSLPHGQQYVINKHSVTRQIWVASPFTGAHHFQLKEGTWVCTRTQVRLEAFFCHERNIHAT